LSRRPLKSEIALTVSFLIIISGVPIAQTGIQLSHGERAQFTDLFRYVPTEKNLRQFDETLKEDSWFEQKLRPLMQRFLFKALGDTGSKAIMGREGWLFYRPDVRWVVEPDRPDTSSEEGRWVEPAQGTDQDSVVRAIVHFRDQLKERGIKVLVMPVPGKPSIYPQKLSRMVGQDANRLSSPTLELIQKLSAQGVQVVDLFDRFSRARQEKPGEDLYLAQDTHWTPAGAEIAAEALAEKLRSLGWAPARTVDFTYRIVRVRRYGDILEMIVPRSSQDHTPYEDVECRQVLDATGRALTSSESERPGTYRYPGGDASVLVLGDSFCRIYQDREPRSLGQLVDPAGDAEGGNIRTDKTAARLLPGSAGFPSQLALSLVAPVDYIVSDGGASTDVRRTLATDPEILEGKKVVVWEFVERDIQLGKSGWLDVPLPPALGANTSNGV
jgi:hypothetical protein